MKQQTVDFYLAPACPWTWLTSRWLAEVADERGLNVRWRPFSLALLNEGQPVPAAFDTEEFRERMRVATLALRVITWLGERGEHDSAGRFYAEFGARFHEAQHADETAVDAAAAAAHVEHALAAVSDSSIDAAIRDGLAEALEVAGPDVGSPVLRINGAVRGFHGPILSRRVTGDDAAALFEAVSFLQAQDSFFEVKRGRTTGPHLGGTR